MLSVKVTVCKGFARGCVYVAAGWICDMLRIAKLAIDSHIRRKGHRPKKAGAQELEDEGTQCLVHLHVCLSQCNYYSLACDFISYLP